MSKLISNVNAIFQVEPSSSTIMNCLFFIALLPLFVSANPSKLDWFRETADTFSELADESEDIIEEIGTSIQEGPMESFKKLSQDLVVSVDWDKHTDNLQKATKDAFYKDLSKAMETVDLQPVKKVALDFLKVARNVIEEMDWDSMSNAGRRIMNATRDVVDDIGSSIGSDEPRNNK